MIDQTCSVKLAARLELPMPRPYQQKKRAEQQEETRRKIVEATIALHEAVGGPKTTVSAIAERAGVERATVYRHFPDERSLLEGCTGHYLAKNQPPDPHSWLTIEDPVQRLQCALEEIYAYHRRTEPMSARAVIDMPQMPVLRQVLAPMFAYWEEVATLLIAAWDKHRQHRLLAAAVGHAIAFQTWQSLVRAHGLDDDEAVALMVRMVACAAHEETEAR
jgi:AcrR family transcriptional regulator